MSFRALSRISKSQILFRVFGKKIFVFDLIGCALLAEGHRRTFQHHGRVGKPGGLTDTLLWDEAGIRELDLPVVAETGISNEPKLLMERAAAPWRCWIVQSTTSCNKSQTVRINHAWYSVSCQVWVEGNLVPLDDILERHRHLLGAVTDGDELLISGTRALL